MKNKQSGFTLLEVMFTSGLLTLVIGFSLSAVKAGQDVTARGMTQGTLEDRARSIVESIAIELRTGGSGTLFPEIIWNANGVSFMQAESYDNGAILWGDPIIYGLQYVTGETDDGTDENGNGMIDEMEITRTQDTVINMPICHYVKENGLVFSRTGNSITISVTLQGLDARRNLMESTVQTTVQMRN